MWKDGGGGGGGDAAAADVVDDDDGFHRSFAQRSAVDRRERKSLQAHRSHADGRSNSGFLFNGIARPK